MTIIQIIASALVAIAVVGLLIAVVRASLMGVRGGGPGVDTSDDSITSVPPHSPDDESLSHQYTEHGATADFSGGDAGGGGSGGGGGSD
jgi:hypothetical protein